jgi:UDP-N-acetylmuramoylalanine--D-glutamate ligase
MARDKGGLALLDHRFNLGHLCHGFLEIPVIFIFLVMMERALVLGLGISGVAAAEFLLARGFSVIGVDSNLQMLKGPEVLRLQRLGVVVQHDAVPIDWKGVSLLILSPGVSQQHPLCQAAIQAGVESIGEAELAFRYLRQPCLGITGTNGKTTVTLLATHVLNACGIRAKALGNVGDPLTAYVSEGKKEEVAVVELSSYQLETMTTRGLDAAVILNITPDHLDRYVSMEEYAAAKYRIAECVKEGGALFVQGDVLRQFGGRLSRVQICALDREKGEGFWTDKRGIFHGEKLEALLPVQYREWGVHESENAMAAWVLCRKFGVDPDRFCKSLQDFKKPPHRIEFVASIDGVAYYDDSKGTNLDAVVQAVQAMKGPVILIAGGVHKGSSYLSWSQAFEGKVKKIIAIGQAAELIEREMAPFFAVERAQTLADAVLSASSCSAQGDNVLLSPGCASFDMFRDYAHRGKEFQHHVHHLEERRHKR